MRARCLTLNLKGIHDEWFEKRSPALIEGIRKLDPDVICLQESTIRQETPLYNQARALGAELGMPASIFSPYGNPAELITRDQGGIALISKWKILDCRGRRLPAGHAGPSDSRNSLFALLESPEGPVGVVTTHLSWRPEELEVRLMQMGIILREITRAPWSPCERVLLMGDFNCVPTEPAILAAAERLQDAWRAIHPSRPGFTWSEQNPLTEGPGMGDRRIDYIFCDRAAKVLRCDIVFDRPEPVFVSDHFGLFAEVEWPGP